MFLRSAGISQHIQQVQQYINESDRNKLIEYFKHLLQAYRAKEISKRELKEIFSSESYPEGLTGFQWMISNDNGSMNKSVIRVLCDLESNKIITPKEILDFVIKENSWGLNAFYYAFQGGEKSACMMVSSVVKRAYQRGSLTVGQYQQILAQKNNLGESLLSRLILSSSFENLKFYFLQWTNTLGGGQMAVQRFASEMIMPKSLDFSPQIGRCTPFQVVLQVGGEGKLNLYLNYLRFCLEKEGLSKKSYWKMLTESETPSGSVLQYIKEFRPLLLNRYFAEIIYCAKNRVVEFSELLALFRALALNPEVFSSEPKQLKFADKKLQKIFNYLLRFNPGDVQSVVDRLPGLCFFNARFARARKSNAYSLFGSFEQPYSVELKLEVPRLDSISQKEEKKQGYKG